MSLSAWLIYDAADVERNRRYIGFYFDECAARSIRLSLITVQELTPACDAGGLYLIYRDKIADLPDFVVFRAVNPILHAQLENMGVPVFNSAAVAHICNNKMLTYQLAGSLSVPVMETRCRYRKEDGPGLPYPVVVKPLGGHGGAGVALARNDAEFAAAADAAGSPFLVQEEANQPGRDLRVYVLGHTIRAAMLRTSETDFRANFCLGGKAEVYTLSEGERRTVQRLADAMDYGLVGIDFVFHSGRLVLNEIEDVVGARMLYTCTDIRIVGEYLDYILTRLEQHK